MALNFMNVEDVFSKGISKHAAGLYAEAEQLYRQVLQMDPNHVGSMQNLGVLAFQVGRNELAIPLLRQALQITPNNAALYCNLADVHTAVRQGDEAMACYLKAIELDPDLATAYNNLGIIYSRLGRVEDAIAVWEKALVLSEKPSQKGRVLVGLGGGGSSVDQTESALLGAAAANNLGNAYLQELQVEKAVEYHRRACKLNPGYPNARSNMLRDLNHLPNLSPEYLLAEHKHWWELHGANLKQYAHKNIPDPGRKLRLGFISPDFREHSVTHFLLPLFQNIDRSQFELVCYAGVNRADEFTEYLAACSSLWRNSLSLRDEDLAALVNEDAIDILFDLSGHTSDHRLVVFGYKPAPIQICYLGYPMTTGAPMIDYRIGDPIADPPGMTESHYTERLLRLPKTMWCYQPPVTRSAAIAPADLPAEELPPIFRDPQRPFTFGSFNNCSKISAVTFDLWVRVLQAVPNSRMVIKASAMADRQTRDRVGSSLVQRGVAGERIMLVTQQTGLSDHFAYYSNIDLALDTIPYNGTTTTCEALWMNVPVVTMAGHMHIERVGASLLTNVGLPSLVAQTPDQFVEIATGLAHNIAALTDLRSGLRAKFKASPLMDGQAFARDFGNALRGVWREWCANPK